MTPARRLLTGLALAAVALVGYLVARSVLPGQGSAPAARGTGAISSEGAAPGPRAAMGGPVAITTGVHERSERGAVAAAASYLRLLDQASVTAGTSAGLRALSVAPLTAQALGAEAASAALTLRLSAAGPAFMRGWRLGWRIDSYTPMTARVAIWTMGMVQSAGDVVAPDWSTTVCTLRWSDTSWKVSAAQTASGPTPPPDGTDPGAVAAFVRSALLFHQFDDAP